MRIVLTRREGLDSADGVNIFIVALAQAFSELNHQVMVVVGSLQSDADYTRLLAPRLDLKIIALSRRPTTGLASIAGWLRAKWIIDRFRPDLIIHSEAVPLPLHGKIIHVVHDLEPRNGPLAPVWRTIRRFSIRRSDHVVATTTELRDELVRDLGMPPHRFVLIPKCVDLQLYQRCGLAARERAILHAGTLPYKDPGATVRAFGALDDPSVTLYVTGEVTGPTQEAVDALPNRLRQRVILLGPADGRSRPELAWAGPGCGLSHSLHNSCRISHRHGGCRCRNAYCWFFATQSGCARGWGERSRGRHRSKCDGNRTEDGSE